MSEHVKPCGDGLAADIGAGVTPFCSARLIAMQASSSIKRIAEPTLPELAKTSPGWPSSSQYEIVTLYSAV